MLPVVAFVVGSGALALASWRAGMSRLNPITVFLATWTAVVVCYRLPWFDLRPLSELAWGMVWLGAIGVVSGVWCAWYCVVWTDRSRYATGVATTVRSTYDENRLKLFHLVAVTALAASLALELLRVWPALENVGGLSAVWSNGEAWRRGYSQLQASTARTGFDGDSLVLGAAGYVLFLGTIALVWAGHYAARRRWGLALAPLGLVAAFSLVMLQRFVLIYSLLIFLFSWRLHAATQRRRTSGMKLPVRLGATAAAVALTVAAITVPVHLRQPQLGPEEIASNAGLYLVAGTAGLSAALEEDPDLRSLTADVPDGVTTAGHGRWTFSGLVSLAQRGGIPVEAPPVTYAFTPVQASGPATINVYSYLSYFYLDFGWAGILAMSFALGLAAGGAYSMALRRRAKAALPIAALLMTSLAMSFFAISLIRDFQYLFLTLCSPFLTYLVLSRPEPMAARTGPSATIHAMDT